MRVTEEEGNAGWKKYRGRVTRFQVRKRALRGE